MAQLLVGDVFTNASRAVPHRTAVILDDASLTFGELQRRGNRCALALRARGVEKGQRVVSWTGTSLDLTPLFVGLAHLGAVFTPINGLLQPDEAADMAAAGRPSVLLVDEARLPAAPSVAAPLSVPVLCITGLAGGATPSTNEIDSLAALADGASDEPVLTPELREDDPHVIFFTSGSTGVSKGVVLSHRVSVLRSHPGALLEPRGVSVCPYPLFHMAAWTQAMQAFHGRDAVVFTPSDAAAICAAIEQHRATRINCIPAVWRRILDHLHSPAGANADLSSLRYADSGTSATPLELLQAMQAALPNTWIRVFYGATETGAATMLEHNDIGRKPGSAGAVAPLAEIRVSPVDAELQVRGPLVFDGYFENDTATAAAFDDGWYRTGDLAEQDDDGFIRIVGRRSELIRTGGESVVPAEVEAVIATHPAIVEVAVVGVPDDTWGEVVCAAIVVAPGSEAPSLDEVVALCASRLARFKQPRRVVVLDALPRTSATGQVQRRLIVEALKIAVPEA
jgi:acyl-CoA synthetase (AMP-forming)/AMP-acid ligase II